MEERDRGAKEDERERGSTLGEKKKRGGKTREMGEREKEMLNFASRQHRVACQKYEGRGERPKGGMDHAVGGG